MEHIDVMDFHSQPALQGYCKKTTFLRCHTENLALRLN